LDLAGSVALLLWGIRMVQTGLQRALGAQLRSLLGNALRNRMTAFLAGMGVTAPEIGVALTLVFAGGAAGKLICGFLGARLGILPTVLLTEGATAAGIVALLPLPLVASQTLLPLIAVALNGSCHARGSVNSTTAATSLSAPARAAPSAMIVGTTPMIAIPGAAFMRPVAMIVGPTL
jgi:Na+/Pi-cotransporter